ncbi:putative ribonuclease H-like domain-containing protein [Tanacetum coccineum]|uniref:Ribonuclease H-like domain-containing protein n=1 Tax=Tanacetum coccineum TaxID=301880 RepID=A0ABQ4WU13_9ASTR
MKNMYCLVVTDDYSRFSWVFFLATKDETSGILKSFITRVENLIDQRVKVIRCDNGTEFKNKEMNQFCDRKGIKREFSVAITPQQNGVAGRKNRTLIEAARTMLANSKLPTTFLAEAVNTACYVQNRVLVTKPHNKTPYELFLGRKPALGFMKQFGCPITILNTIDHLGKFDGKADEGFFVGYSINSKAFRVFNSRTRIVEENLHVQFSENTPNIAGSGPNWRSILISVFRMELEANAARHNLLLLLKVNVARHKLTNAVEIKVKTANREVQLQAPVDGKKIIITKASVRCDLQLNDEEGMDCLPNATIFEELTRIGKQKPRKPKRKDTEVPQPSRPIDNVVDEAVYEEMDDSLERAATTTTSLDAEQDRGNINKTQSKETLNEPSSLGSCSGSGPKRQDTMGDTIAQTRVTDLEKTKTSQAQEITSLKRRVKRLEKKGGLRTHKIKRLYKVGLSRRVESSKDEGLGEEDASKQGRIADIDIDAGINLVSTHFDADIDMFGVHDLVGDEVVVETEVSSKDVNLSVDEVTLAQALAALKITAASTRPKAKGLFIHEHEQAPTSTVSSQQPSQLNVQDKVKGKMVKPEPVKKLSKKDQLMLDEELAFKLQAELEEEERLVRQREEEANIISWDNVQAMIDADYQMAQQMQEEEQEKLSIEEKSKLFVQLLEARKKHFAAMRAQEKRKKPPTKAQKRNIMSTYLKNMAGYKQNQLKNKSFDDTQKLFDKAMKRVDEDKETEELQRLIEVVPDKEEVAINAIPLATKPPSIIG